MNYKTVSAAVEQAKNLKDWKYIKRFTIKEFVAYVELWVAF